ncbi:hypothetical protein JYK14_12460 [Siccirubricoccus sp. KC 17139]|uniref:Uncharacterized protein n=1 Tax=Siccirubricoccus soli TaxID=2899147 RepID=A0ABT1D4W3_9PROT|nr:hypothetical protein [Siccirubricoccus soli]MCO6416966.1 hypothetical protein [Siccirubricoccus soli]MCP2683101.1 hypothetical protein [Siccirubricoccus soli]
MTEASKPPSRTPEEAAAHAAAWAPLLPAILLTHFPDQATLDALRPEAPPLAVVAEINRAVARAALAAGSKVLVQVADAAEFRAWLDSPAEQPRTPMAWRRRAPRLMGDAALAALGLDLREVARPKPRRSLGSPAERLVQAAFAPDPPGFEALAEELLQAGRQGVLDQAVRRAAERYEEESVAHLENLLFLTAEAKAVPPTGRAVFVVLPVVLPEDGPAPEAAYIAESFLAAGVAGELSELRLLPAWRAPGPLLALDPVGLRRALEEMLAGREPAALPPATEAELAEEGVGLLLGVNLAWDVPEWAQIDRSPAPDLAALAEGGAAPDPQAEEHAAADDALDAAFEAWAEEIADRFQGCAPLNLVGASELEEVLEMYFGPPGGEAAAEIPESLAELADFVLMAEQEAGGAPIVGHIAARDTARLTLALYTKEGRFLDSRDFDLAALPPEAVESLGELVELVETPPGR